MIIFWEVLGVVEHRVISIVLGGCGEQQFEGFWWFYPEIS